MEAGHLDLLMNVVSQSQQLQTGSFAVAAGWLAFPRLVSSKGLYHTEFNSAAWLYPPPSWRTGWHIRSFIAFSN